MLEKLSYIFINSAIKALDTKVDRLSTYHCPKNWARKGRSSYYPLAYSQGFTVSIESSRRAELKYVFIFSPQWANHELIELTAL